MSSRLRRLLATGVAGAVTFTCLGFSPGGQAGAAAPAAEEESPLVLESPDRVVERSYGRWVYGDFGVRLTAHGEDFELWAKRDPDYLGGIDVVWRRDSGDVGLPAGSMTTWQGLDRFATLKIFKKGKRIRAKPVRGCFNGSARKVGPAGPAQNPYPWGCPWNPYTLGSVMGVAQDYSGSMFQDWGGTSLRLRPGRYRVVTAIRPRWREAFGISDQDAQTGSRLVVKKARRGRVAQARDARRAEAVRSGRSSRPALEATTEAPTADAAGALAPEYAPDLRSLPAFDISMNRKGTALRFGATVWNGGSGPMVIEGFEEEHEHARRGPGHEHERHLAAYQYYFDGSGEQTGYERVGEFTFHRANHNHWHFEDFARYNLFHDADRDGEPDSLAVRSTKASFCLANTDAVDHTVPNADWRPEYTDLSSDCGGRRATYLRQVLSNGSGDTYHQFRAGQAFRVKNLPDGHYLISVEANPADDAGAEREGRNLVEQDYANNDSLRKVTIRTRKNGRRIVRAAQVGIIDENEAFGFFRR